MKLLKNILFLTICLSVLVLQGCTKDETGVSENKKGVAVLTLDIVSGKAATRASNISSLKEDYVISSVRIFAIDEHGNVEKNKYFDDVTSSAAGTYVSMEVVQSTKKTLYVVVNEPSTLTSTLDEITERFQLKQLNYIIAESLNNEQFIAGESLAKTNRNLPMSATKTINATQDSKIVINVDRVVARVDLMVDKDELAYTNNVEFNSSTSVSVSGLYYNAYIFKPTFLHTPSSQELNQNNISSVSLNKTTSLSVQTSDKSTAKRLFSFYIAERTYNIDENNPSENRIAINIDNITVDGNIENINSTILLGNNVQPYLTKINRNYVYRIYATYRGKKLNVKDEYAIEDWTIEELDGDIEGVMISAPNQVVMDWTRLNNKFSVNDVAFGSNRDIDFYVPSSYNLESSKYEFKKCEFIKQKGISYDLMDLSDYGVADEDNILRSIPWLTEAKVVFDSEKTGHFEFTYQLGATPYYLDIVPIQLVSANVRKQINVIYDNGYVPGDLLQANDVTGCWGDAFGGIVFAKRGDALHPTITEDILEANSNGLYEGDITMSASEADQYCKEKLGPKWYAPNKAQLADIQRHVLELGTSYRLNNTADAYYWSSQSDGASNYWAISFEKGLSEPEPVSTPAQTEYFIRCITNL